MEKGFEFCIDRGGTFTDVYAKCPDGSVVITKLLSRDPDNYDDAPREGIRRVINSYYGHSAINSNQESKRKQLIDGSVIKSIRMGTTVATNALLERKGEPMALLVTKGFRDILYIGNQSRPSIFDLTVTIPEVIYSTVVEVDERILLASEKCCLTSLTDHPKAIGITGETVIIEKTVDINCLRNQLLELRSSGINSLAVALLHSYIYPEHENQIESLAKGQLDLPGREACCKCVSSIVTGNLYEEDGVWCVSRTVIAHLR